MHLVTYSSDNGTAVGVLNGDNVSPLQGYATMLDLIQAGPDAVRRAAGQAGESVALSSVRLLAPIANPGKIVAIGLNYRDHAREQNVDPPKEPLIFAKFTTSIIGPGEAITWEPELTTQVDYEAELGVVIGREARNVSREDALAHVFGYTIINDVTARDLQFGDKQWVRGKSLDTFCPIGPAIVTANEIPDPQALKLRCLVNGTALQDSSTAEMIFSVAEIVAHCSRAFTLKPGDVIATGTPAGVGMSRNPKVFLKDGDTVAVEIEKIGVLENPARPVR